MARHLHRVVGFHRNLKYSSQLMRWLKRTEKDPEPATFFERDRDMKESAGVKSQRKGTVRRAQKGPAVPSNTDRRHTQPPNPTHPTTPPPPDVFVRSALSVCAASQKLKRARRQ